MTLSDLQRGDKFRKENGLITCTYRGTKTLNDELYYTWKVGEELFSSRTNYKIEKL